MAKLYYFSIHGATVGAGLVVGILADASVAGQDRALEVRCSSPKERNR